MKIIGKFDNELTVNVAGDKISIHIVEDSSSQGEAEILLWEDGAKKLIEQLTKALNELESKR